MKAAISVRFLYSLVLLSLTLLLIACQPIVPSPAAVEAIMTPTDLSEATPEQTPEPAVVATSTEPGAVNAPTLLAITELDLEVPIEPMGWEVTTQAGQRTTRWVVPEESAGWALNSAGVGEDGNVVLAGHQARNAAVFAPIALGDVALGQEIDLTGEDGTVFAYHVVEVSDPIPVIGATDEENAQSAAYLAPTAKGQLTLVTGWPVDTTTHRVFVVAELVGATE